MRNARTPNTRADALAELLACSMSSGSAALRFSPTRNCCIAGKSSRCASLNRDNVKSCFQEFVFKTPEKVGAGLVSRPPCG